MLPRTDLDTTRLPAKVEAPTPVASSTDGRLEVFNRLMQITLGKQLQADVLSLLNDGTYLVRVADTTARMALPAGTKAGDSLSLVFLAKEPRPTFLLTDKEGSATASLSTAGRLIDRLIQSTQEQGQGASTAVQAKTPLFSSPTAIQPEHAAATLHNALEFSGLFYESHMHEWISGSRPVTALAHEPQAQLPSPAPDTANKTRQHEQTHTDFGKPAARLNNPNDGTTTLVNLVREAQSMLAANFSTADAIAIAQPEPSIPTVQPEAARIINQQLNTLEHQQFQWRGELWPGQQMEWEVTQEKPQGHPKDTPESTWSSAVRFQLPTLGEISATVRLVGERVHIQVNTRSETSASSLRAHSAALSEALAAAGSPLESLLIKKNEPA